MRDVRGFTLLEVLVALAILSATLVLAYEVISGALRAAQRSDRWTEGALLAEDMLIADTAAFPEVQETDGTFPKPYDAYKFHRSVRQAQHADAREVEITVTWPSDENAEGTDSVSVTGLAAK